jgi:hypothetical protein
MPQQGNATSGRRGRSQTEAAYEEAVIRILG